MGGKAKEKTLIIQDPVLKRGFTATPNAILTAQGLSLAAKTVYAILLMFAWRDDECWPGQERLAKTAGCTGRTIRRYLVELKEYGLISWLQRGLNQTNIYYIHDLSQIERLKALPHKDRTKLSTPDRTDMSTPDRTNMSGQDRSNLSDKEDSVEEDSIVVVVEEPSATRSEIQNKDKEVMLDPVSELVSRIARITGGATISKTFAEEAIKAYHPDHIDTALTDMQAQLARGVEFTVGVGAWLRTWLKRKYETDQKPPKSKTPNKPKQPLRKKTKEKEVIHQGLVDYKKRKKAFMKSLYIRKLPNSTEGN